MSKSVTGKVQRIYPDQNGCYVTLDANTKPKYGYFFIKISHPNYNSLFSLALGAAVNRYKLRIDTVDKIKSSEYAEVRYMLVDWQ